VRSQVPDGRVENRCGYLAGEGPPCTVFEIADRASARSDSTSRQSPIQVSRSADIRELQNVIERAVILCDGEVLSIDETWLPDKQPASSQQSGPLVTSLINQERQLIESALSNCRGRVSGESGAAVKLGIPRSTLESKIRSLRIDKHRFRSR
jgi:transcriptional regulator of acetoin/glycerol metabolism